MVVSPLQVTITLRVELPLMTRAGIVAWYREGRTAVIGYCGPGDNASVTVVGTPVVHVAARVTVTSLTYPRIILIFAVSSGL